MWNWAEEINIDASKFSAKALAEPEPPCHMGAWSTKQGQIKQIAGAKNHKWGLKHCVLNIEFFSSTISASNFTKPSSMAYPTTARLFHILHNRADN